MRTPILVVDDAQIDLKLMRLLLTHEGFEVRTASDAEEALDVLSQYRPELIFTDINLPGMNGLELTRRLKENPNTSLIRVVALTACAMAGDRERALKAGCDDYIVKPIETCTFGSKVRALLAAGTCEKASLAKPDRAPLSAPAMPEASLSKLRTSFLQGALDATTDWLVDIGSSLDRFPIAEQLHQWIGSTGILGYLELAGKVRKAEQTVSAEPRNIPALRAAFTDLYLEFSELLKSENAVPEYVLEALAGKPVALIGFAGDLADAICETLLPAQALPRLFDTTDDPSSRVIRDCAIAILHVRPETQNSAWLRSDVLDGLHRPVLFGRREHLATVPSAVRAHAIDCISDSSEPEDVRMRLAFAFSRNANASSGSEPAATPNAAQGNEQRATEIVIADDDPLVRILVRSTLENFGMSCRVAENGAAALDLIRQNQPPVAVLDVNMPEMDGFQVLRAIRVEKLPTQVIMLTSLQHEQDVLKGFNLGADDYVTKPFNPFEIVARLKRLLQ